MLVFAERSSSAFCVSSCAFVLVQHVHAFFFVARRASKANKWIAGTHFLALLALLPEIHLLALLPAIALLALLPEILRLFRLAQVRQERGPLLLPPHALLELLLELRQRLSI